MTLLHVAGARPNFVKAAPVMAACARRGLAQQLVHTGQHYDDAMSAVFFRELEIPPPDANLEVGSGSHAEQTGQVMIRLEKIVLKTRPRWVVVYGDVNSTVAAALVCAKLGVPVAHVEAGLRAFDRRMPEEINRLLTDQIADLLLTPSEDANRNLAREGIAPEKIKLVGNVMIDTLVRRLAAAEALPRLQYPPEYVLATLHRPSNVDDEATLARLLETLGRISQRVAVIWPLHPRTRTRLRALGLDERKPALPGLRLIEPLGYLAFLGLERHARAVITDSGGVQEETTFMGVPCLTLRENTERPVTVTLGTNVLIGQDYGRLEHEVAEILAGRGKAGRIPPLWDGQAAERVAELLD